MPQPPDAAVLPPYSGPDTDCLKCGATGANTQHRPARGPIALPWNPEVLVDGPRPERMARQCRCCGYQWDEAPQDAKPAPAEVSR
ncbi:hypothetical protein [Planomonospora sp. ID82291]|uniref:hypothetical protein n=1 Tax=Planomonospora sp. ID82291 TaxID=2738136 RepID=UPI0018C40AD9|nr:hypothetical protein [Planomonospora sp. ID82291]MBG0818944.1 hypothetical protein [Planomonospora sp. ID82291]